jgi:hypothetical protein
MSSTTSSSSNFQLIVDALADYVKQTETDLTKHPFAEKIQSCDSADAIFQLLQHKANEFKTYRDTHRKLINCLSPVVQFLHTVSGTLGEALVLVSHTKSIPLSHYNFTLPPSGTVSPGESNLCRRRCSPRGMYILYFPPNPCHILVKINQAASGITTSYDALIELFESVANFLKRLHIYTEIPFTSSMTGIVVKILVEVLSILALATKQIKQGRFSKRVLT